MIAAFHLSEQLLRPNASEGSVRLLMQFPSSVL